MVRGWLKLGLELVRCGAGESHFVVLVKLVVVRECRCWMVLDLDLDLDLG